MIANLPAQPTPFIGRDTELAEIARLLADPACRLLTLTGPGGIGKTRLAIEVAAQNDFFRDGVFFVPLQPLDSIEFLAHSVADALGVSLYGQDTARIQLLNSLRDRHLLLVMDNFEHLLDGVDLVVDILHTAPAIKILTTSREALNLQEEWVRPIGGMRYPDNERVEDIDAYSALKLFIERARRVRADFDELPCAIRICQVVNGIPLAIELAATWLKSLSCEQIVFEIQRNLDFLATSLRNVPERHRSMRAVFDQSWHLLTAEEQQVFSRLSVFRGGFQKEAAAQVAGASLHVLSGLVDKSMLTVNHAGRYAIHELLRQYAEQKLGETTGAPEQIQDRHTTYYLDFLHKMEPKLKGPEQIAALDEIEADLDNIRTAWQRASTLRQVQELDKAIEGLALFYMMRSRAIEGERVFGRTLQALGTMENALLAEVLVFLARFVATQDWDKAGELARRGLSLWRSSVPPGDGAFALGLETILLTALSHTDTTLDSNQFHLFEENLTACRHNDDRWGEAWSLCSLGTLALETGRIIEAYSLFRESASIFQALGSRWAATFATGDLAQLLMESGRYEEARELFHANQVTNRTMGDSQGIIYTCWQLAEIAYAQGDDWNVKSHVREALQMALEIQSHSMWLPAFSPLIVHLLTKEGATEQAVELAALHDTGFNHLTYRSRLIDRLHQRVVEQLQSLQAQLPSEKFAAAKQRGETTNVEMFTRALLDGLLIGEQPTTTAGYPQLLAEPLSARELEILRLVAQGLSNREIAHELVISLGTVKTHIHNICSKLDAASRTQAIARARELKLI